MLMPDPATPPIVKPGKARPDTLSPDVQRKLWLAIEASRKELIEFRKQRMLSLALYIGNNYSVGWHTSKTYVNLINIMVKAYMRSLVARSPRVLVTARYPQFKSDAADYQLALNRLIEDIDLGRSLRRSVLNAMFGVGVHMVGIDHSGIANIGGAQYKVTQPFADAVDQDDVICDMSAKVIEETQFQGNRYYPPLELVQEDGSFENLQGISTETRKVIDPDMGENTAASFSQMTDNEDKYYKPCVTLLNVWLPLDGPNGIVVTMDNNDTTRRPLKTVEWNGPENGPYRWLSFESIPDNVMPLPAVANLIDLHKIINIIYIKNANRAKNSKRIVFARAGSEGDIDRAIEANDMDVIRSDTPGSVNQVDFGGVDNVNMAFGIHLKELFSWAAGNLDSIAGLSAMSSTVGQDRMLLESASQSVADMQLSTMKWVTDIVSDLAWYLVSDPLIQMPLTKRIEGTDLEIPIVFAPQGQASDWLSYNFSIEPYSMQHSTPQSKMTNITGLIQNVYIPMMSMMQEQRITLDIRNLTRLFAKYGDMPELYDLIQSMEAPIGPDRPSIGQKPAKAPVTTRNYTRENRSVATQQGGNRNLMNMLMGQSSGNGKGGGA